MNLLCSKYAFQRKTGSLQVPYYVKKSFHEDYTGSIRRLEQQVEDEYISNLRANCFRERSYSKYSFVSEILPFARNFGG